MLRISESRYMSGIYLCALLKTFFNAHIRVISLKGIDMFANEFEMIELSDTSIENVSGGGCWQLLWGAFTYHAAKCRH